MSVEAGSLLISNYSAFVAVTCIVFAASCEVLAVSATYSNYSGPISHFF
jgi:hypothetical protein